MREPQCLCVPSRDPTVQLQVGGAKEIESLSSHIIYPSQAANSCFFSVLVVTFDWEISCGNSYALCSVGLHIPISSILTVRYDASHTLGMPGTMNRTATVCDPKIWVVE
jgi:hypothetical protein